MDRRESEIVHDWVKRTQGAMPIVLTGSTEWHNALASIPGTYHIGPSDRERVDMIVEWTWERLAWRFSEWVPTTVINAWEQMLTERTGDAARNAAAAYSGARDVDSYAIAAAVTASTVARRHPETSSDAGAMFAVVCAAANVLDYMAHHIRGYSGYTAGSVAAVAESASSTQRFWRDADPVALLNKLTGVPS